MYLYTCICFKQREYDLYFYVKRDCLLFSVNVKLCFRIFRDAWKSQLLLGKGVFRRGIGDPHYQLSNFCFGISENLTQIKRLSVWERIRQISDLHRLASFFQWKSIVISNVEISHLFEAIRFFSFFSRRFSKWPRHLLICLDRLWNFALKVGRCQNTGFCSNNLNALHAKVSSFFYILTV